MSLAELLLVVQELPRADKLRLYYLLAQHLTDGQEEPLADAANENTTRNFRENNEAAQKLADYPHQENYHKPSDKFEAWTPAQDGEAAQKLLD